MHATTVLVTILPFAAAFPSSAFPGCQTIRKWVAPGPTDSRGPCPGLNTLANHSYLYVIPSRSHEVRKLTCHSPHDGRNITPELIAAAAKEALNWDPAVAMFLAGTTINTALGVDAVDLEGLNTPNVTEHHASLTRLDATVGDSLRLNLDKLEELFADSDSDYFDVASLGRSRARVEATSGALVGNMNNQANLEAAAILTTFPEPSDWAPEDYASLRARKDRVKVFFTEERLPVELGWKTPEHQLTLKDLSVLPAAIDAAKKL
ncbi:putative chloroperoxidase-like protein [Paramyrothecium foliicola]|nr:putative chloroperoxidase-like protein [Paramyrothecium foliicola]